jgi:hypothetical protein
VKPAPFLQVAALVSSISLSGSYILYRGGVIPPPRMPGSAAPAVQQPSVPSRVSTETEQPRLLSPPANVITIAEPGTQSVIMSTTKSGPMDFRSPEILRSERVLDPGLVTRPERIELNGGISLARPGLPPYPPSVLLAEPAMMSGSKSGYLSFPQIIGSAERPAGVFNLSPGFGSDLKAPPEEFRLTTGQPGVSANPAAAPAVLPARPTNAAAPFAAGGTRLVNEPQARAVAPQNAARAEATPPRRVLMPGSKSFPVMTLPPDRRQISPAPQGGASAPQQAAQPNAARPSVRQ